MLKSFVILSFILTIIHCKTYKTKVLDIRPCPLPQPPFADHQCVQENLSIFHRNNKTLISGNTTVTKACDNCKWRFGVDRLYNGTKRPIFRFADMTCKHFLVQIAFKAAGIPIDGNSCQLKVGSYSVQEVNLDDLENRIRLPFKHAGTYEYTYKYYSQKETHSCWILDVTMEVTTHKRKH